MTKLIKIFFLSFLICFAENSMKGKLYENFRKPAISLLINDQDWPILDTYFRTIGAIVRSFRFFFPNVSDKLNENFVPTTNLPNIESGTEETANVLTQNEFFP